MLRIPANKLKQLKNNINHLIENEVYQVIFTRLVNFNITLTDDQADRFLAKIDGHIIKFEWETPSGVDMQELRVNSDTKPFLKNFLTEGISMREKYYFWDLDDVDRIHTRNITRITLTQPTIEPVEVKKPAPKSDEWTRNPKTGRLIKVGGPTYKKLYTESKPTPLQSTVKPVQKPIPSPRTVKKQLRNQFLLQELLKQLRNQFLLHVRVI